MEFEQGEKFQSEIRMNEETSANKSRDFNENQREDIKEPEPKSLKVVHIPPVDGDDLLTRKNIKLEKAQPNQKIEWASPKKRHHEKLMDKNNLSGN